MISNEIRKRLRKNEQRFFACDNISNVIREGELDQLIDELADKFSDVLDALVIDIDNDPNSRDTGRRLAKMYVNELMSGRYYPAPDITAFPNDMEGEEPYRGMIVIRAELHSMCSHHHQPVTGVAYIGVIPAGKVIGLSKYIRVAQHEARRGSLQEDLCNRISVAIKKATASLNVGVYIELEHGCCTNRGVMAKSSLTQTTVLSGSFYDPAVKAEFFDNIKLQKNTP